AKTERSLAALRRGGRRLERIAPTSTMDDGELRHYLGVPAGRTQHFLRCPTCPRKCVKLYLPQCTQQESDDALRAQRHLQHLARHFPNHPGTDHEALLHARYHLLFHPRQLKCRHCLGIRYGETRKTTTRQ
ncbi:MAG: hypothetical protein ACF8NJ_00855, partial [Phycisphaerales bacterium JB038]